MVAIIDYGVGNLSSISNMFKKVGVPALVTSEVDVILKANKLLLPGVGAFDNGMAHLNKSGLRLAIEKRVLEDKVPVLGICLGMQMLTKGSEEGKHPGLGWVDAETIKFKDQEIHLKIPHMGWNNVYFRDTSTLFKDLDPTDSRFYFVHSFHVVCQTKKDILAETEYGYLFTSSIGKENIFGTQFHPEKSHRFGMKLFENFGNL
jgi:imidazole glycerol-phosphate synthase subunit HisH